MPNQSREQTLSPSSMDDDDSDSPIGSKSKQGDFIDDAFSDDDEAPGISYTEAVTSLTSVIIGAGVMSLPALPLSGGYMTCSIFLLISAFCSIVCSVAMYKGIIEYNEGKANKDKITTFEQFGRIGGGACGEWIVRIFLIILFIGVISAYSMLMGQQLELFSSGRISSSTWILILLPFLILTAMIRDVSFVARLTPLSTAAAVSSCLIIILKSLVDSRVWEDWEFSEPECFLKNELHHPLPQSFTSLGVSISILLGSFASIPNVPNILSAMREPKDFPAVNRMSIGVVACLYLAIMLVGHYGYGSFMQDNVGKNMVKSPRTCEEAFGTDYADWTMKPRPMIGSLLAIFVSINLFISVPLLEMTLFNSIVSLAPVMLKRGGWANRFMRVCVVCLCVVIASSVPGFFTCFGLFMSICVPMTCVFLPIIFSYNIRKSLPGKRSGWLTLIIHFVLIVLGIFASIFGTMDAIAGFFPADPVSDPTNAASSAPIVRILGLQPNSTEATEHALSFSAPLVSAAKKATMALLQRKAALMAELGNIDMKFG